MKIVKCKSCGAPIVWIETVNGKSMPCDAEAVEYQENRKGKSQIVTESGNVVRGDIVANAPDTLLPKVVDGTGYISHFATCPYANQHRRK